MNYTSTKNAVSFLKTATLWLIFILNSLSAYGYKSSIICTNDGKYDHSSVLRMHTSEEHCFLPNKNYPPDALSKTNTITGVPWLFKLLLTSVSKDGYAFIALDNMPKLEEPDWNKITETYYDKPPQIESLNTDSIEEHLIPPNLDNSIEEGLQRQWKQLTTQQKNLSNTDSNSDSKLTKSFIYLATVDRQFRVVIVPARKLTQRERKQLNEVIAQALIKVYRKRLNNKEKDPAEVIGVSNAGDDDDNDDDTTQNNPSDYSAFYVMDDGQLSEPGILNTVLGKRLRVLNILRNRARDAINQGNTQLARILRDRITLVEIDIEYFSTQLIPGDSPERYSSNIAELILNTLQRDSQEIQEYEDHQHYFDLLSSLSTPPDLKAARGRIGRQAPGGSDQQGRPDSGSQQSGTPRESSGQEPANRQPSGADGNSGGQGSGDGGDGDRRRKPADPHDLSESTSQSELEEEAREYVERIWKELIERTPEYEKLNDLKGKKELLLAAAAQVYIDLNSKGKTRFSATRDKSEMRTKEEFKQFVKKIITLHKSSRTDSTLNRVVLTTFINRHANGLLNEIRRSGSAKLDTISLKSISAGEVKIFFQVRYNEDGTCKGIGTYYHIAAHKQGSQKQMQIEFDNSELKFRFL